MSSAPPSGSSSDDKTSYSKPTNTADNNGNKNKNNNNNNNNKSAQPDPSESDFFTSLKRLADGHISATLHSLFGIPTTLQAPSNWIMDRTNENRPGLAEIEQRRKMSNKNSEATSTALRKSSSDGENESGGGSVPPPSSSSGSSAAPTSGSNLSASNKAQREYAHAFMLHGLSAVGLMPALLAIDQEVEKQRREWQKLAKQEWEKWEAPGVVDGQDRPARVNPFASIWKDIFGQDSVQAGRMFGSFFEEFLGDEPFGASKRRRDEQSEEDYEDANDEEHTPFSAFGRYPTSTAEIRQRPCVPFSENEFKSLTQNKNLNPDFLKLLQAQVEVMKDAGWLCDEKDPKLPLPVSKPVYERPVHDLAQQYPTKVRQEPETELDLHEYYTEKMSKDLPKAMVSSTTTTTSKTNPNGVTKTRYVREQRYSDGSVERIEKEDEKSLLSSDLYASEEASKEGWNGWGEYGYPTGLGNKKEEMRGAFEKERMRNDESLKSAKGNYVDDNEDDLRKGWFWASGKK